MEILINLKIDLPYDSSLTVLGIYPKAMKSVHGRVFCMSVLIVA